jgi:dolichol-phosphate mannosyltransferase
MLELVRSGEADVAVGSRFLPGSGEDGVRYKPAPERVVGTSLLRLLMRLRLGQPISDGTSGLYAVDRSALALLADDYICEAPEVEALVRITDAKLRLVEVPVHMRQREHGESSFRGKRAVELVVTIGLTLFAAGALRRRHQRRQSRAAARVLRRNRPKLKLW